MPTQHKKIRVIFEQPVIPHYRVPFLKKLADQVDLLVVASNNRTTDGLKDENEKLPFKNLRLTSIPETSFWPKSTLYHPDLIQVIQKHEAEVLISFSSSLDRLLTNRHALNVLKKLKTKIIWMGCDGYQSQRPLQGLIKEILNPRLAPKAIRGIIALSRVDYCLPHSTHGARYLRHARFVPKNKISVTYNTIDTTELTSTCQQLKKSGGVKNPLGVVFIGRLAPGKRVKILITAFAEVLKKIPEAKLSIIGEGSEEQNLKNLTKQLEIEKNVSFLGAVYEDSKQAELIYQNSLGIMPGLGGLGFNTLMACGLPIIYTNADGTEKDLFEEGTNGWYFNGTSEDLAKKMIWALEDPNQLITMGEQSEFFAATRLKLDNMVKIYLEAIRHVLT